MKCPTPCYMCDRIVELDKLNFNTAWCDCEPMRGCSHGICDRCIKYLMTTLDESEAAGDE